MIVIGPWLLEQSRGLVLLEAEGTPEQAWDRVPATKIVRDSEQEILARFWEVAGKRSHPSRVPRLV